MGRHSAPDGEAAAAPAAVTRPRPGRHAQPEDDESVVEVAPDATTEPVPDVAPEPQPGPIARGNHATAADLALLRRRPDVRNRCIAAIVVPFVLYTAVLILLGAASVYLIWVWVPLVTAGVLAGSILDSAHRREPPT